MCRVTATIAPPGIFFGSSTATLEDFRSLVPVALPLCSSYSSKDDSAKRTDARSTRNTKTRRGLRFVPSADGVVFQDEEFVREVKSRIEQLVLTASATASTNNVLLARKALKYRRMAHLVQPAGACREL